MGYTTERYENPAVSARGLNVTQCGWQKCDSGHGVGPVVQPYYSVTFVLSGKGIYTADGRTYPVCAGEGFVMFPGAMTRYAADKEEPWEYAYAVFYGGDVPALLRAAGLSGEKPTFSYPLDDTMRGWLEDMRLCSRSGGGGGYDVAGYFALCMSRIIRQYGVKSAGETTREQYVRSAMAYLGANYPYSVTVEDAAAYVGLERSYLYRLFREQTGMSPSMWLCRCRLEHASRLLRETACPVTEIAGAVGYYDVAHFAKTFRAHFGCTPMEYREREGVPQEK